MFDKTKIRYSLNDIVVTPAITSNINSRNECDTYYYDTNKLPLFVSPMNNIINDENWKYFSNEGINVIIPRDNESLPYQERKTRWEEFWNNDIFVAMSLKEFSEYFILNKFEPDNKIRKVCVDLANGHMKSLTDMCRDAKSIYGKNLVLMTGNIANPETYIEYAKAGIDYVRIGIGTGVICTTAANSSIHYPMASLIDECKKHQQEISVAIEQNDNFPTPYKSAPKIVADGGFNNYDQIIKALALGADYVMCGKLFAQCVECCTNIISDTEVIIAEPYKKIDAVLDMMAKGHSFKREYYGMSTRKAQKDMGGNGNKTAEGILIKIPVKYTVAGWTDNFKSYLRSAMSYTGFNTIESFIGGPNCILISNAAYHAYFK